MSTRKPDTQNEEQVKRQGASEDESIRHKGPDRSTTQEKHSGEQPDGNGGTGKPAAFPPHN